MPRSGGNTMVAPFAPLAVPAAGELVPAGTALLSAAAERAAITRVLAAMRAFSAQRLRFIPGYVEDHYTEVIHDPDPARLDEVTTAEREREATFRLRQTRRMRRDLERALRHRDPDQRRARVQSVIDRERRYSHMHEDAVAQRAAGAAGAHAVEGRSPIAAGWELGLRHEHTPDCVFLNGRVLRWTALKQERMVAPIHTGCGCRYRTLDEVRVAIGREPHVPTHDECVLILRHAKALGHG